MEFVVSDAKFFKSCIDAISNLVDEGNFELSSKGMHLRSMDPSQIAMVDFNMPRESFEKIDASETATLGVNLVDFGKVLSRSRSDEKLSVSLEEKENKFLLEFSGESKRKFKMPLLDLGGTTPKEPKIAFDSSVKIKGGAFKEMLRDAALFSSHVVLFARENDFVVEAKGDGGETSIETRKDASTMVELKTTSSARSMFPLEYLDDMTRACPDDGVLSIDMKTDLPVKISFDIGGKAMLAYYLAPRVENL